MLTVPADVLEFLRESNAIEDVHDADALHAARLAWEYLTRQPVMTTDAILTAHRILMVNQPIADSARGAWRTCAVSVGGRPGRPWYALPELMAAWCERVNRSDDWQGDHVQFERIHPFVDGNGRIGRMLINWQRRRLDLPLLVIRASERDEYYQWFR